MTIRSALLVATLTLVAGCNGAIGSASVSPIPGVSLGTIITENGVRPNGSVSVGF